MLSDGFPVPPNENCVEHMACLYPVSDFPSVDIMMDWPFPLCESESVYLCLSGRVCVCACVRKLMFRNISILVIASSH